MKYATPDNIEKISRQRSFGEKVDESKIPEALGAAALTLLGVQMARKGPKEALKPVYEGFKGGVSKLPKHIPLSRGARTFVDTLKQTARKVNPDHGDFEKFKQMKMKSQGNKIGDVRKLNSDVVKKLYKEFGEEKERLSRYFEDQVQQWKKLEGFDPDIPIEKLKKGELDDLREFLKQRYKTDKGQYVDEFFKDPQELLNKSRGFSNNLSSGLGFGAGAGSTSFLVHALGEKYFDKMDDDKVRKIVRESYSPKHKTKNKQYPNDRANRYIKKYSADLSGFDKIKDFLRNPKVKEELSEAGKIVVESAADSAILASLPIAFAKATKRDIRNGFKKIEDTSDLGTKDIVIDVPLKKISKEAAMHPYLKKFLKERKKTAIRVLPWVAPAALINKALTESEEKSKLDKPIPEGHARIRIQTGNNRYKQDNKDFMMKRGSLDKKAEKDENKNPDETFSELLKNIDKAIKEYSEEDIKEGTKKMVNYKPKDGVVGRDYQDRMFEPLS
jgi:hypothetical protein